MYVPGTSGLAGTGWFGLLLLKDMLTHRGLSAHRLLGTILALVVSHGAAGVWTFCPGISRLS